MVEGARARVVSERRHENTCSKVGNKMQRVVSAMSCVLESSKMCQGVYDRGRVLGASGDVASRLRCIVVHDVCMRLADGGYVWKICVGIKLVGIKKGPKTFIILRLMQVQCSVHDRCTLEACPCIGRFTSS